GRLSGLAHGVERHALLFDGDAEAEGRRDLDEGLAKLVTCRVAHVRWSSGRAEVLVTWTGRNATRMPSCCARTGLELLPASTSRTTVAAGPRWHRASHPKHIRWRFSTDERRRSFRRGRSHRP